MSIRKTFSNHTPTAEGIARIKTIRQAFSDLADAIEANAPPSRERSLAMTAAEESCMWATKAIAVNDSGAKIDNDSPQPKTEDDAPFLGNG